MDRLLIKLRVGEKIGFGFTVVGLLFLAVIWFYQHTINQSLMDYESLLKIHASNKDHLMAVESNLLLARQFEAHYMQKRDKALAEQAYASLEHARQETAKIIATGDINITLADQLKAQLNNYEEQFKSVEAAWIKKGINEDSGLQGSFRDAVHDLQAMAGNLNTENIYLTLLQIRRSEKDLGLRRDAEYQQRVHRLLERLDHEIQSSQLLDEVKQRLRAESGVYREQFDIYAEEALAGQAIEGGKGPFRDSAHRLENLISQYYVPDLERDILQLRRREKDYLLRGDDKYVEMALDQISMIQKRIENSLISAEERKRINTLLQRYQSDFLALVDQNSVIIKLTTEMEENANRVSHLVNHNVQAANNSMSENIDQIRQRIQQRTRWMLWAILAAIGMGVVFTIKITRLIVRPIRKMTDVLETLTHTELISPIRHMEGGRDEVNNMAGFINTLVDHRNKFINWWRNSMDQEEACAQLRSILNKEGPFAADVATEIDKLRRALVNSMDRKSKLIDQEVEEVGKQTEAILSSSAQLLHPSIGRKDVDEQAKNIHQAAGMIHKHLEMLAR